MFIYSVVYMFVHLALRAMVLAPPLFRTGSPTSPTANQPPFPRVVAQLGIPPQSRPRAEGAAGGAAQRGRAAAGRPGPDRPPHLHAGHHSVCAAPRHAARRHPGQSLYFPPFRTARGFLRVEGTLPSTLFFQPAPPSRAADSPPRGGGPLE